ncbi:MAG: hypothetical protein U0892_04400 [Pirellulales bacterium]
MLRSSNRCRLTLQQQSKVDESSSNDISTAHPSLKDVRLYLLGGQSRKALECLNTAWNSAETESGWSRGRIALYMGLAHQRMGHAGSAGEWFSKASELNVAEMQAGELNDLFASMGVDTSEPADAKPSALRPRYITAETPEGKIKSAVEEIRKAKASEATADVKSQIRYATWLILFGELTSKWDELQLYTSSVDAIEEGRTMLVAIEQQVNADSALEAEINADPALAIRLDAAQTRSAAIEQRLSDARNKERARLTQLREVARNYRSAIEKISGNQLLLLSRDYDKLKTNQVEFMSLVSDVSRAALDRQDLYLFSDEPNFLGTDEYVLSAAVAKPLSDNLISLQKSIVGYSALQLAGDTKDANDADRAALLDQARKWAEAALKAEATIDGAPAGADPANVLGAFVEAAAVDVQTIDGAKSKSLDAAAQSGRFDQVRKAAEELASNASVKAAPSAAQLAADIQSLHARIQSPESCLSLAAALRALGETERAESDLLNGVIRHRSPELAGHYVQWKRELGRDPQAIRTELDDLIAKTSIDAAHPAISLAHSRLATDVVGTQLATAGIPEKSSPAAAALIPVLDGAESELRRALQSPAAGKIHAELESALALVLAHRTALGSSEGGRLKEAVTLAQNAEVELGKAAHDGGLTSSQREAIVNARLALGFCSLSALPAYRDEGIIAFTAAMDAKVSGTNSTAYGLMGSPLLKTLSKREADAGEKSAAEERSRRRLLTQFVEATFTKVFGDPRAASQVIDNAMKLSGTSADGKGSFRAADQLSQTDGFSAEEDIAVGIRSFKILTEIESKDYAKALSDGVSFLHGKPLTTEESAKHAADPVAAAEVANLQSPLQAAAIGLAVESYLAQIPVLDDSADREPLKKLAIAVMARADALLKSSSTASRFPHLISMVQQSNDRLNSSDGFIARAVDQFKAGRQQDAEASCIDGLAHHPQDARLWKQLLTIKLDGIRGGKLAAAELDQLAKLIETGSKRSDFSAHDRAYFQGLIFEQLNEPVKALSEFERAAALASDAVERIRAKSKVAVTMARIGS